MTQIKALRAREVLDSRGNPTVQADAVLEDGSFGQATVPSGASTGEREALEKRDGGPRFLGKGVLQAVKAVNGEISSALIGKNALDQRLVDTLMVDLDGTDNKSRLGANALLGVSLAVAKAAAAARSMPLYRYLGGANAHILPVPGMNIINGGAHADNPMDFQEFMIMPIGAKSIFEAVRMGSEVFHTLQKDLKQAGHSTNVGDEGGFAPDFSHAREALDFVVAAIEKAGYAPKKDIAIALDPATSEFFDEGAYHYRGENLVRSPDEHIEYLSELVRDYPIVSIEDPMAENDYSGWQKATERLGAKCQMMGDDNFCTNVAYLQNGIDNNIANSILIKINQIGTLTETLDTVDRAHKAGYTCMISHRSGETEDTTVADLAVATNCGQIKTGSLSRSDRTAKYNRMICIEEELGGSAAYGDFAFLRRHGAG